MRVLILTSATGGGHNMRARSLQQWAARERPEWTVKIHEVLEGTHALYRFGVGVYNFIQRSSPRLHHFYFNWLEAAAMFRRHERILGRARFVALLEEVRPDVIVSVHGSTNHGFFDIARQVLGNVRCVTYCAEMHGGYGMSRHWVNPEADLFIGSLPETDDAARVLGMPPEKLRVGGFLLNPRFYDDRDDPAVRAASEHFWRDELRLDPARFTLLLSTGANSVNDHTRFLHALRGFDLPIQVVALCGSCKKTRLEVLEFADRPDAARLTVRALPTTDRMALLMRGASAIVARPGSGTTNEAIQSGCPLIFNQLRGLMPQEMITERFCRKHGLAVSVRKPQELAALLHAWVADPSLPAAMAARMADLRPKTSPIDILAMLEAAA